MVKRVKFYLRCWRDKIIWFVWPCAETLTEIEDFLERHGEAIAKAIEPVPLKHTCIFPPGSQEWRVNWRFPFLHVRRRKCICLCEINQILNEIRPGESRVIRIDVGDKTRTEQRRVVELWRLALRRRLQP